jgi:hypothetical protein
VAPDLLGYSAKMSTALELVYEYRYLMGKCRAGAGLSMDEVEAVEVIEGLFAGGPAPFERAGGLSASVRGGRLCDRVELVTADLDQVAVHLAAFVEPGAALELSIDDSELRLSYRFKCRVLSVDEDLPRGRQKVVLALLGAPLLIRRGPRSSRDAKSMPPRPSSEPRVVAA